MESKEAIAKIQEVYPKFTKIQWSMVNNSDKYGVQLTPKAKRLITEQKPRKRPNRLTVVRCKDCKWATRIEDSLWCGATLHATVREGYCHRGRKDDTE